MDIYLNNIKQENSLFAYNDGLNFERFLNNNRKLYYCVSIEVENFISLLQADYVRVLKEIKGDDEIYNDTSIFAQVNYCSLRELIKFPNKLTEIIDIYLRDKLFNDFLIKPSTKYIINSIDNITNDGNKIVIKGQCFEKLNSKRN